jgi:hypothetical protein
MGPIQELGIELLEDRITPDLTLTGVAGALHAPAPLAFENFDNPSPGFELIDIDGDGVLDSVHPNFVRSVTAIDATMGTPTDDSGFGNEGPWSAHYQSPVICADQLGTCP